MNITCNLNQNHFSGVYNQLAVKGGVVAIDIEWDCDLDWNFMKYCLPKYNFRLLDDAGWNFRFANYFEENHRGLVKAYGIKFLINVSGIARKFDLKNTVIVLITSLGLVGIANVLCEFVIMHCSSSLYNNVMEKKYEAVNRRDERLLEGLNVAIQSVDANMEGVILAISSLKTPPENKPETRILV